MLPSTDLRGRRSCLHRRYPGQWIAPLANSPHGARRGRHTSRARPPPSAGAIRQPRRALHRQSCAGPGQARFAARVRQPCAARIAGCGRVEDEKKLYRLVILCCLWGLAICGNYVRLQKHHHPSHTYLLCLTSHPPFHSPWHPSPLPLDHISLLC
jgi:hypothetical protein